MDRSLRESVAHAAAPYLFWLNDWYGIRLMKVAFLWLRGEYLWSEVPRREDYVGGTHFGRRSLVLHSSPIILGSTLFHDDLASFTTLIAWQYAIRGVPIDGAHGHIKHFCEFRDCDEIELFKHSAISHEGVLKVDCDIVFIHESGASALSGHGGAPLLLGRTFDVSRKVPPKRPRRSKKMDF